MDVIKEEEKQPDGPKDTQGAAVTLSRDEIKLEDITTDVENIQVECNQISCSPVINTFRAIYKLFCHLMKCFKFKKE